MTQLRVGIVQFDPLWERPDGNRAQLEEQLSGWEGKFDVVVLPEMFTTGFSMNASAFAEIMHGATHRWMKLMSNRLDAAMVGSWMVHEAGYYWNRLVWVEPSGLTHVYNKTHLFTPAGEGDVYRAGEDRLVVAFRGFRICPLICYDLRFGYISRQDPDQLIDLYLYIASWPEKRMDAWKTLLKARAIENQAFVVGVNRVGQDGEGLTYSGGSSVFDGEGTPLFQAGNQELVDVVLLNLEALTSYRATWPFWKDQKKTHFFQYKFGK